MKRFLSILAVALLGAVPVSAATYPTFELDLDQSNITVSGASGLSAAINKNVGTTWTPDSANDSWTIGNLFNWSYSASIWRPEDTFNVAVELAFSSPDPASTSTGGSGTINKSWFFGTFVEGVLTWSNTPDLEFAQGSKLAVNLEGGDFFSWGSSFSTGATFTGNPATTMAPAPLPASGLLLIGGLGGLALLRRRRSSGGMSAVPA